MLSDIMSAQFMRKTIESEQTEDFLLWHPEILEGLDLRPGSRVLDVGCGYGSLSFALAERFPGVTVIGVDEDGAIIEKAMHQIGCKSDRIKFFMGDVQALEYKDGYFDFVLSKGLLHYVEDRAKALREIARVTRPGGGVQIIEGDDNMQYFHPTKYWWIIKRAIIEGHKAMGYDRLVGHKLFALFSENGFFNNIRYDTLGLSATANEPERLWIYLKPFIVSLRASENLKQQITADTNAPDINVIIKDLMGLMHNAQASWIRVMTRVKAVKV